MAALGAGLFFDQAVEGIADLVHRPGDQRAVAVTWIHTQADTRNRRRRTQAITECFRSHTRSCRAVGCQAAGGHRMRGSQRVAGGADGASSARGCSGHGLLESMGHQSNEAEIEQARHRDFFPGRAKGQRVPAHLRQLIVRLYRLRSIESNSLLPGGGTTPGVTSASCCGSAPPRCLPG